jgi:DNA polymerase IV
MEIQINKNIPHILHIDLNSCFATAEQCVNPHLRGKPIVVCAYASPNGCVVAPSIEAKQYGIKTGMTLRDARLLYPNVIVRTPTPSLYRDIHMKFKKIFQDYSPDVTPKSIDEAVLDMSHTAKLFNGDLVGVGKEIKRRLRTEINEWMSCNVGIGTNRFLAKTAASLHKPDGLDVITHENLEDVYKSLKLTDLCGINTRFEARLNAYGIFTPLQFYNAPLQKLKKQVFRSILGYYWYLRLRGHEIDAVNFGRKSFGNSYALRDKTAEQAKLSRLLMKLCEKTGRRLRSHEYSAQGVAVWCLYTDGSYWHQSRKQEVPLYTTHDIFIKAMRLLNKTEYKKKVANLAVTVYELIDTKSEQLEIFNMPTHDVSDAADDMNDRYGEFTVIHALMAGMNDTILDRVAFGGVKDLEDLYAM